MRNRRAGITLIELLIAFAIFTMMMAGMIALMVGTLQGWRASERGKDTYERAQLILRQIEEDLRCAYVDEAWVEDPNLGRLLPAQLRCEPTATGDQQLALVRTGTRGSAAVGRTYANLTEVMYVLDPERNTLWRAEQPFDRTDRRKRRSFLRSDAATEPAFRNAAVQMDNGVLHLEFRFWSQVTRQWEPSRKPRHGGPSLIWDSSRRELNDFFMARRGGRVDDPADFVMPRMIRIILVVEPITGEGRGTILTEPLGPRDAALHVEDTRALPDPPAFVRVSGEWIEYDRKEPHRLMIARRGGGTRSSTHDSGTTVHFGVLFITDVVIPLARDAR